MAVALRPSTYAVNLTGNGLGNNIQGNAAANQIDGREGADVIAGFAGDDRYVVDNAGDQIIETAGNGTDTVMALASYVLQASADVEVMRTLGSTSTSHRQRSRQ